jgi:hypothetical protein
MTTRHTSEATRTSSSATRTDPSLPLKRLRDMGYQTPVDAEDGWLSARQLFPWHLLLVMNPPDRLAHGGVDHLGLALVRRRYGLDFDLEHNARSVHILCSNLPVGTPDEAARLLAEEATHRAGSRRKALKIAALRGLAHLEECGGRGGSPVSPGAFLRVLRSLDPHSEDDAARAALHLIARHRRTDALEFSARVVLDENPELRLSAIDTLLWLGEPGLVAFQQALRTARGDTLKALKAVEAGLANDLDPMHQLVTSENWAERNGATRVLRSLVVHHGIAPEGPLEILLSRYRDDGDHDNRTSIGFCLGDLISSMGPAGVDPVLALVRELPGDSEPLLNGIVFAGAPGLSVARIRDLMDSIPRARNRLRSPMNRLLTTVCPEYPAHIRDWLKNEVIQGLQWGAPSPGQVRAWLEDGSSVPDWQVLDTLLGGKRQLHDGSLTGAALGASPSLGSALECLIPRLMNQGQDIPWAGMVGLVASSWRPNHLPLAWLRVALGGLKGGPPLPETPENIGCLLAVAASPLKRCGEQALELLAAMSTPTRSLAAHLLRTLPAGIAGLEGRACHPPASGFGPRGREFPGLGLVPFHREAPLLLEPQLHQFFLPEPPVWRTVDETLGLLIQTAQQGGDDYKGKLWPWNEQETRRQLEDIPAVRVQQAIVAIHTGNGCAKTAARLAQALGPKSSTGDLGPLVDALTCHAPVGEDPSDSDEELEEILRDLA